MKTSDTLILALPGNETLAGELTHRLGAASGAAVIRKFPDGETYVRILSEVQDKTVILVSTLFQPDEKLLPLYFLARTAKDLGAKQVILIAPYLAYMRQDKRFHPGEGITSDYFGEMVSRFVDRLITIDPHLHRRATLSEVYSIPCHTLHAADLISNWIKENVENPVLVGPDSESKQWVSAVAKNAGAPFIVLEKIRHGDRKVEISVPDVKDHLHRTPVLVDDIISTARTMMRTAEHLNQAGMQPSICIGVHAVFAENAYQDLLNSGVAEVITCDTIPHPSNRIPVVDLCIAALKE